MSKEHRIHLHVVLIQEADGWVAQALQYDFAGQGDSADAAFKALAVTIASHLVLAERYGIPDPLANVDSAPTQYWELFESAARKRKLETAAFEAPGMPPAFVIQAFADSDFCSAY